MEQHRRCPLVFTISLVAVTLLTEFTVFMNPASASSVRAKNEQDLSKQQLLIDAVKEIFEEINSIAMKSLTDDKPALGGLNQRVIVEGPVDTSVYIGSSATLYCKSDSSDSLRWFFTSSNDDSNKAVGIVRACLLNPAYADHYDVDIKGDGQCNLVIHNATLDQAGEYECQETSAFDDLSAQLYVLEWPVPVNTAALKGSAIQINCRRATQNIAWLFSAVRDDQLSSVLVVNNCEVLVGFGDMYHVDKSNESCNLIINQMSADHAGSYTCQDYTSSEFPLAAQLIFLASDPVCSKTFTPAANGSTVAQLSCRIDYIGNIPPRMMWIDKDGDVIIDSRDTTMSRYVESSIERVGCYGSYNCQIYFNAPLYDPPPTNLDADTAAPDYTYNYTFYDKVLIHQHINGSSFFNKNWSDMIIEQGDQSSDYWIGLEKIHLLTSTGRYKLRFDLQIPNGTWYWEEYATFIVGNSSTNYTLNVASCSGNTDPINGNNKCSGFCFLSHSRKMFSTFDRADPSQSISGPVRYGGAFWYMTSSGTGGGPSGYCYSCLTGSPQSNHSFVIQASSNSGGGSGRTILLNTSRMSLLCRA